MTDFPRLIEHAFPLKQTSLDSVHEKNVRHGHISTLHIWPARRPLAACRAALIATLLPDPGTPEKRRELCEKIGGKVVKKIEKKKMPNGQVVERVKEETDGGILHWGRETENVADLEWFRQEIRKAYGGRAPKVLDPFAGGGAIPLEAMRLGCEATAVDINPVAWFILKCTLEYPQKLAGQKLPLPEFILNNEDFVANFKKASGCTKGQGKSGKKDKATLFSAGNEIPNADLAWHVRAWGQWVLERARRELAELHPTYADFESLLKGHTAAESQPMRLVPLKDDGTPDIGLLNAEFPKDYLENNRNPRWVAKPTVAYLWARTVKCKNCRAALPLLKTRWLCKTDRKRVLLEMTPCADKMAVAFGIQTDVPVQGGNAAQKREHDKRIGAGTMSRSGAQCPCCGTINTMEDIRLEGKAGRMGSVMTAVVVDGQNGKEYRRPTEHELKVAAISEERIQAAFKDVPFGVPEEPTPSADALGMRVPLYGFDKWRKLFTPRQLTALGTFVAASRAAREEMARGCGTGVTACQKEKAGTEACSTKPYPSEWVEAVGAYLGIGVDRQADYNSAICNWDCNGEYITHTFQRFALPIKWDYSEINPLGDTTGNYLGGMDWVARYIDHAMPGAHGVPAPVVTSQSSTTLQAEGVDFVLTDPPYYDAIPYSDLMDFFYIWLRRSLNGMTPPLDQRFSQFLSPKWDHDAVDGELIDDCSRHGNDARLSKQFYEDGMAKVFVQCEHALKSEGRLVIVFANKQPDAWETLVAAIIRAGFTVDGSWPIQTEMSTRTRAQRSAALASSVWLVCKKRPDAARPGWDNKVLEEMRSNIATKLREFWDAGIRGPDFIWAATGPALEAYSKHPVVRKADEPDATMSVGEFLTHVRRMVVDYIVGQVLSVSGGSEPASTDRLDEVTAYYLLHRNDFGLDNAPVGACILYATACGLSDTELEKTWDLLARSGAGASVDPDDNCETTGADSADAETGTETGAAGQQIKLKAWSQRHGKSLGYEAPGGKTIPLIDRIHRLIHLWKAGDVHKVDEYLDGSALRKNELFKRVVQSLIELSDNSERAILESISNHVGARGAVKDRGPVLFTEQDTAGS